jgi:hypothetical protein
LVDEQQSETQQLKLEWVKPEVRKMGAGSAEDGQDTGADNTFNPS